VLFHRAAVLQDRWFRLPSTKELSTNVRVTSNFSKHEDRCYHVQTNKNEFGVSQCTNIEHHMLYTPIYTKHHIHQNVIFIIKNIFKIFFILSLFFVF